MTRTRSTAYAWGALQETAPGPSVPPVTVALRTATEEETPRTARRLAGLASANGWTSRTLYSRGPSVRDDGSWHGRVVDTVSVRLRHPDGRAAVAVYHDGRHLSSWTWRRSGVTGRRGDIPRECGHRVLCARLSGTQEWSS